MGSPRPLDAGWRSPTSCIFAALIAAQTLHSAEEIAFDLPSAFAPTRAISLLVSREPIVGFAVLNAVIVAFGVWCYVFRVRASHRSSRVWMAGWAAVEALNGIIHMVMAVARGGYFPGLGTAPLLLVLAALLSWSLASRPSRGT